MGISALFKALLVNLCINFSTLATSRQSKVVIVKKQGMLLQCGTSPIELSPVAAQVDLKQAVSLESPHLTTKQSNVSCHQCVFINKTGLNTQCKYFNQQRKEWGEDIFTSGEQGWGNSLMTKLT